MKKHIWYLTFAAKHKPFPKNLSLPSKSVFGSTDEAEKLLECDPFSNGPWHLRWRHRRAILSAPSEQRGSAVGAAHWTSCVLWPCPPRPRLTDIRTRFMARFGLCRELRAQSWELNRVAIKTGCETHHGWAHGGEFAGQEHGAAHERDGMRDEPDSNRPTGQRAGEHERAAPSSAELRRRSALARTHAAGAATESHHQSNRSPPPMTKWQNCCRCLDSTRLGFCAAAALQVRLVSFWQPQRDDVQSGGDGSRPRRSRASHWATNRRSS